MGTVTQWIARHPAAVAGLKTAAAALLLALLFWYVDVRALVDSIRSARPEYAAAGALLLIPQMWMQFVRWRYLLRAVRCNADHAAIFTSLAAGFAAGFFTPAQLGEIGGRLYGLGSANRSAVLTMAALDKVYVFGMTVILGCAGAAVYFPAYLPSIWSTGLTVLAVMASASTAALLLAPGLAKRILAALPARIRAHRFFTPLGIFETEFGTRSAIAYTLQTLVFFGIIIMQYHCFVNAFAPAPAWATMLSVPIVLFVKSIILPISIGDLGVRESASVFFYLRMGVPAAAALNGSLCIFAVNVVLPAAVGIIMLTRSQHRK